jgi:hypothetical protein
MPINATATWTSATAQNTALATPCDAQAAILVTLIISGTVTAGQVNFEASDDGVNWYSLPGLVQSTFAIFTNWQPSFGSPVSFQFCVSGFTQFRLRLATVLTGTGSVTANLSYVQQSFLVLVSAVQQNGANLQMSAAPVTVAGGAFSSTFINATGAAVNIKNSFGNLYGLTLTNNTAAVAFVEFFDTAVVPTLGTTAVAFCVEIPASGNVTLQPCEIALKNFVNGIGFAVVTIENGTTPASVTGMIFWK